MQFELLFWIKFAPYNNHSEFPFLLLTHYPYPVQISLNYSSILHLSLSKGKIYGPTYSAISPGIPVSLDNWNMINVIYENFPTQKGTRSIIRVWNFVEGDSVFTQTNFFFIENFPFLAKKLFLHIGDLQNMKRLDLNHMKFIIDLGYNYKDNLGDLQYILLNEGIYTFEAKESKTELVHKKEFPNKVQKNIIPTSFLFLFINSLEVYKLMIEINVEEIHSQCSLFSLRDTENNLLLSLDIKIKDGVVFLYEDENFVTLNQGRFEYSILITHAANQIILNTNFKTSLHKIKEYQIIFMNGGEDSCTYYIYRFFITRLHFLKNTLESKFYNDRYPIPPIKCNQNQILYGYSFCINFIQCSNNSSHFVFDLQDCDPINKKDSCLHNQPDCLMCQDLTKCSTCKPSFLLQNGKCVTHCQKNFVIDRGYCVKRCPEGFYNEDGNCLNCDNYLTACILETHNYTFCSLKILQLSCSVLEYYNNNTQHNKICPSNCLYCKMRENTIKCLLCDKNHYLYNGNCFEKCSDEILLQDGLCSSCIKSESDTSICFNDNNLQPGLVSMDFTEPCPIDHFEFEGLCIKNYSLNCLYILQGRCIGCHPNNFLYKGICIEKSYFSELNMGEFASNYPAIEHSLPEFTFYGYSYFCPQGCNICEIDAEGVFRCNEKTIKSLLPSSNIIKHLNSGIQKSLLDEHKMLQILRFCKADICVGFPRIEYYILNENSNFPIIDDPHSKNYEIFGKVTENTLLFEIENFPICNSNNKGKIPICFYKCPKGFYMSSTKQECFVCDPSCVECNEFSCLKLDRDIFPIITLELFKNRKPMFIQNRVIDRISIGYSFDYDMIIYLIPGQNRCPENCKACNYDFSQERLFCTECINVNMIEENGYCYCKEKDDFFDHESHECIPDCNYKKIFTDKARECVKSCFQVSSYDLYPYLFTLGDTCIIKCPKNHIITLDYMFFEKLSCVPNEALEIIGNPLKINNKDFDLVDFVDQYGTNQVSSIIPLICFDSDEFKLDTFNSIEKKKLFFDLLSSKIFEKFVYGDLFSCLLKYFRKFLGSNDLELYYKMSFWLILTSTRRHENAISIEEKNLSIQSYTNLTRESFKFTELGINFKISLPTSQNNDFNSRLIIQKMIISDTETIFGIIISNFGCLDVVLINLEIEKPQECKLEIRLKNASSEFDIDLENSVIYELIFFYHYFIYIGTKAEKNQAINILPSKRLFFPKSIEPYDESWTKFIAILVCLIFGLAFLAGIFKYINYKIKQKGKFKFIQMTRRYEEQIDEKEDVEF